MALIHRPFTHERVPVAAVILPVADQRRLAAGPKEIHEQEAIRQQGHAHQENTGKLLCDLWHHAPLSRAMLAERNGLTKATVSSICQDLTDLGLIRLVGMDRNGMGRPGTLLELDPYARCAIGVEISTNYSAVVLTNFWGEVLWHDAAWLPADRDRETVLSHAGPLVARAIAEARRQAELGPLLGIGLAVPGAVDPGEERLVTAPAMGRRDLALKERYERCFGLPVVVDAKARATAVAEALHGSAEQVEDFVYVSRARGWARLFRGR